MIGTQIHHYKIIEKIGAGGMGEVYLAEDTKLNRKVALKFLPESVSRDREARERLIREAQAASRLNHPNILTIHAVEKSDDRDFIVMEYIDGQSLGDYCKAKDHDIDHLLRLVIQIGEGLQEAHSSGITHRDLKPSNILVDASHRVHILDFGLAKIEGATRLTRTGSTVGTAAYMSPEQTLGKEADHRSDLFSLGILLYEMITGRLPFQGDSEAALAYAIAHEQPEPLARFKVDVSDELQRTVSRLLEKDPSLRYQHADDVTSDLKRLTAQTQSSIVALPPTRKNRWSVWMGVAGIAAVLVVAGYLIFDHSQTGDESGLAPLGETVWANSIAVLPFRDFSPNKDQEYFCDGMTDAIIGRLSGVEDLKVISMTSVMRYKNSDRDLKRIGRDLLVNTILEGSIQREDNRIRVTAQLINTTNDAHLWSQTYDRELESVFDIQDDISRAIVGAMRIELLGPDEAVITRRHTEDIEAYNYYARGRHLWNKRTERDIRKAIGYYEEAIVLDPNYALAYSGLADAWSSYRQYLEASGTVTPSEALANAREAAKIAVGLDESLAETHTSFGVVLKNEKDLEGAEREFLRAIELNSGYAWAHLSYSELLRTMARYPEQIREEEIAFGLNPMSIPLITRRVYRKIQSSQWQDAEELYKRMIEIEPNRSESYIDYAYFLGRNMGRNGDALRQCSLAIQIDKQAYNNLAYVYEWAGNLDSALWASNMYLESALYTHNAYDTRGEIFALSGMLDSAVVSFEKALEIKPDFVSSLWQLGNAYMFKREYAKADSVYRIIASHPDKFVRARGRQYLTQIPRHQGKLDKALRMLKELKGAAQADSIKGSQLAYPSIQRAFTYQTMLKDQQSAIAEFKKAMETLRDIDPNNWMVANSRGGIAASHALSGDQTKADQLMAELKRDIGNYGPAANDDYLMWSAMMELKKENYDSAAVIFEKIYKIHPLFFSRELIARCYLGAGRVEEAVTAYENLIHRYEMNRAFWPTFGVMAFYYLAQAYEAAGRTEDAIEQYETFLDIWKDADPGLATVEDARERLARLKGQAG